MVPPVIASELIVWSVRILNMLVPDMLILSVVVFSAIGLLMPIVKLYAVEQLAMSETQFGFLAAPVALILGLLSVPFGRLGDKWGKLATFCYGLLICAAAMWLIATIRSIFVLGSASCLLGLGFVLALVPAAFEWRAVANGWTIGAVSAITYYALVPTVLGYLCWYAGSARTSGTEAALFTAVAPVSAVLFAIALLPFPDWTANNTSSFSTVNECVLVCVRKPLGSAPVK
jgi:MFS family permease